MSNEQRKDLIEKIDEIRTIIDTLQPEYEQREAADAELENRHATLMTLRKQLARDMDALHAG